jgi:hypothetical protein
VLALADLEPGIVGVVVRSASGHLAIVYRAS